MANHVAILVKVFKGKIDCEKEFTHLDAQGVIKVSDLFWQEDLRCSVPHAPQNIEFFLPSKHHPIERVYTDFFYNLN